MLNCQEHSKKKSELDIMVADIDPHVIGITESWANEDNIVDAELALTCYVMGDFNHGHIQWESLESAGGDDHQFLLLTQDCFLTQHVLEPTRGGNVLDLILSSQNELVDNVKVHEPLGSSDHNQIHFNIKVNTGNTYKNNGAGTSTKANIK